MKSAKRLTFWVFGVLSAACLAWPGLACGQAPPGPLPGIASQDPGSMTAKPQVQKPPVQPRTSILGEWKLDAEDSDDARKKAQDASGRGNGGGSGGSRRMGGSYPGAGGGGYGGHRGVSDGESDGDREKMRELFNPAGSLTLLQKEAEVDITDDQSRKRILFTDGRKLQKSKDPAYQELAAHWDSTRLVTEEKNPQGGKMSRTYELSYDGRELYETLHMTTGRSNTPLVIRYVYEPAGSAVAPPPASPVK